MEPPVGDILSIVESGDLLGHTRRGRHDSCEGAEEAPDGWDGG